MCEATENVLWSHIRLWLKFRGRHSLNCRVGSGEATYYTTRGKGKHVMTFGARMVASKFNPEFAPQWRTGSEIIKRAYFGGELDLPGLLAHTCCHEFAHLVQCVNGWISYGSVHNDAFYRILDRIHQSGKAEEVRQYLLKRASQEAIELSFDEHAPALVMAPEFCLGDQVFFEYKGRQVQGEVIKLNRKTVNVKPLTPGVRAEYFRISPHYLSLLDAT